MKPLVGGIRRNLDYHNVLTAHRFCSVDEAIESYVKYPVEQVAIIGRPTSIIITPEGCGKFKRDELDNKLKAVQY